MYYQKNIQLKFQLQLPTLLRELWERVDESNSRNNVTITETLSKVYANQDLSSISPNYRQTKFHPRKVNL